MQILKITNNILFGTQKKSTPIATQKNDPQKMKYSEAFINALADDGEDEYISEEDKLWAEYMKQFNPNLFEHYD